MASSFTFLYKGDEGVEVPISVKVLELLSSQVRQVRIIALPDSHIKHKDSASPAKNHSIAGSDLHLSKLEMLRYTVKE